MILLKYLIKVIRYFKNQIIFFIKFNIMEILINCLIECFFNHIILFGSNLIIYLKTKHFEKN